MWTAIIVCAVIVAVPTYLLIFGMCRVASDADHAMEAEERERDRAGA